MPGGGHWQPVGSDLLLSRWTLPAVRGKMRHKEVLTSASLTLCASLSMFPMEPCTPVACVEGNRAVSHREGECLPLKLSLLL